MGKEKAVTVRHLSLQVVEKNIREKSLLLTRFYEVAPEVLLSLFLKTISQHLEIMFSQTADILREVTSFPVA